MPLQSRIMYPVAPGPVSIYNPAADLYEVPVEPVKKTIADYVQKPEEFYLPSYLRMPPAVRGMHARVVKSAENVIRCLRHFHHQRSQRFNAMCPEFKGPVHDLHVASMRRLQDWKEQSYSFNPTLAPAAKIPAWAIGFALDQKAYDAFLKVYITSIRRFFAVEWGTYRQQVIDMKHIASRFMEHHDYMAWLYWWNTEFKPAMRKWEIYMADLLYPTWEETVDELYNLIIERVEDADKMSSIQIAAGLCSCQKQTRKGISSLPSDAHSNSNF